MTVYTVGHGTRSTDSLAAVVRSAGVGRLIDVRRFPASRRNPHLSREGLTGDLPAFGIAYEWWGEDLGGRRSPSPRSRHPAWRNQAFQGYADHMDTPAFRSALDRLRAEAGHEPPVAVMCAETLWWRCHRRLIADALTLAGVDVVHLLDVDAQQPHPTHPALRVDEDGRPVYDVGVERDLGI